MKRKEILEPESYFNTIARLWNDYIGATNVSFTAQDVVSMMILTKSARIKNGVGTGDSYVDIAGYAACGGEILGNSNKVNMKNELDDC